MTPGVLLPDVSRVSTDLPFVCVGVDDCLLDRALRKERKEYEEKSKRQLDNIEELSIHSRAAVKFRMGCFA